MRTITAAGEGSMDATKSPLTREQRRLRRAERRAKQREANLGRALKMHAVRLTWEREQKRLDASAIESQTPSKSPPRLNIGCSGWFYWDWRNRFYPAGSATKDWFPHYSNHFDTVELNAPFYSWPTVATVRTWVRQADHREFFYSVKACELITHIKRFSRTATLVKDFYFIERLIGPHMGCFLFQLPPSFHYSKARLKRIVDQLDPARRNVVEFRHPSWWNKQVFRTFEKSKVIFCSCSGPRLPDELVQTHDEIYIRFHGTARWYRHDYTTEELSVWADRIRACDPKCVWAYFNNDRDAHAIHNARELRRQLGGGDGSAVSCRTGRANP